MSKIKIIIADDYKIYRDGLKISISPDDDLAVIAEADNGQVLMKILETNTPDIIIMDLRMPVMDGIEATKAIHKKYPAIKILIVTMYEDEKFITHLVENGANGYLLKNTDPDEIRRALHALFENGYYFSNIVNKKLLQELILKYDLNPSFNQNIELTDQEKELLLSFCSEDDQIAEDIYQQLLKKIGVHNSAGLIMYAVKSGLVD